MRTTANRMSFYDFHNKFVFVFSFMLTLLCTIGFASASKNVTSVLKTPGLSIPFMLNQGQIEQPSVLFYAKTFAGTVFVLQDGDMLFQSKSSGHSFLEQLANCSTVKPLAKDPSKSKISMFYPNTLNSKTLINSYNYILMPDIYPNISMKLKAYGQTVEKIFILNPGSNPDNIQIKLQGIKNLQKNSSGELEILPQGVRYSTPKAYQIIDNKQIDVSVQFKIHSNKTSYGFKLDNYNKNYPLIIDPFISGTFFGGDDRDEIEDLAINASGEIYVAGTTWSANLPLTLALSGKTQTFEPANHVYDIFVARFNSNLTQLLSATFIGGSEFDTARAIDIDSDGNVFVCGQTTSADFPIPAAAAFKKTHQGDGDGIIIRFNADLTNVLSASFFGGSKSEMPEDMAIDPTSKEIYITGYTYSSDFDIVGVYSLNGNSDAFVSRFTNDLSQMPSSIFLGGDNDDKAFAIEINSFQDIIIGGQTYSSDFPTRIDSYDRTPNGNMEAFVCEISKDLSVIMGGTYLGGSRGDKVTALVLDSQNQIYATGTTSSEDFPITNTNEPYSSSINGTDVFVAKFDKDVRTLIASTFLGGIEWENATEIIIDSSKNIMIAGTTVSKDFPATPGSFDQNYNDGQDIFIATFTPSLSDLAAATYFGDTSDDIVGSIAIQNDTNLVIAGTTWSESFPVSTSSFDSTFNNIKNEREGFISILSQNLGGTLRILSESESIHVTMSEEGSPQNFSLTLLAENDLGLTINWQIFTKPTNGEAIASGPGTEKSITYIPNNNWYGTDSFVVQISDNKQHIDRMTVYVHVQPEPDYPLFTSPDQVYAIDENSENNTTLGAIQAKDPDNGDLTYSIIGGNDGQAFSFISPYTNVIMVKNSAAVDFETTPQFTLTIAIANKTYTSVNNFKVLIINKNDAPTIKNQQFNVTENSDIGTVVDTVKAEDSDQNALHYRIISGNTGNTFSISETNGKLSVADNSLLNFEGSVKTFDIGVEVSDGVYTQTAIITVTITNKNDPPIMDDQTFLVDENNSIATFQVVATDADEDILTYSILSGNSVNAFTINSYSGLISVLNVGLIDYEIYPVYELSLAVTDGTYSDTANITISLNNTNDNPPVINNQLFYINENSPGGTTIGTVIAVDPDKLFLSYIIRNPTDSPFLINGTTGLLTVNSGNFLDCETTCAYTLTVEANDGKYTSTGLVVVQLKDINESPPRMVEDTFSFKVNENSFAGTLVGQVVAIDTDPNDILTYAIISGNYGNVFRMDEKTGKITVHVGANLDYENLRTYVLGIRVTDGVLSDTANAEILINNLNDNPPVVETQTIYINENTPNGTIIGKILYNDPDEDAQSFSIISDTSNFAFVVVNTTGDIMVNDQDQLDFENGPGTFVLGVAAFDGINTDEGIIVINIRNTNDNVPLVAHQTFYIDENKKNNTWVGTVVANDEDPSDVLSYEILSGNTDQAFKIDSITGKITVNGDKKLNYENISEYELLIRVSDGTNTVSAAISIKINERNDPPTVNDQVFFVEENRPEGTIVGNVTAWDDDAGDVLTFSLSAGNNSNPFRIDSDGNIIIKDPARINYENIQTIDLAVTVGDGEFFAKASIKVNIIDINDSPVIVDQTFNTDEDSINTSYVGTVVATDEDRPLNILTFNILSGNDNKAFSIHESTGEIRVNNTSEIDYETQNQYVLIVQVDDGQSRKDAQVTINIRNTNDNPPIVDNFSVVIDENKPGGFEVGFITASDADNDILSYDIISGNTNLVFAFPDTHSGTLTVQFGTLLDYEIVPDYNMIVQVSDGYYQSTATVLIEINNLNDNIPQVQSTSYNVNESVEPGFYIANVFAQDADDDVLTYNIVQSVPSNAFMISKTTGNLYVKSELDYETHPAYTLTVQASDGTYNSTGSIKIQVYNDNDNPPLVYDQTFAIKETALNGASVGFFVARDFDNDPYSFDLALESSVFDINPGSGEITLIEDTALNNEETPKYELSIQVTDGKFISYAVATILVIDGNDTKVIYNQSFSVQENTPKDTIFGTIAVDAPPGSRNFIIGSGNSNNAFKLDPDTGKISVQNPAALDFEAIQIFNLNVLATVNGDIHHPIISIHIKDANEYTPEFETNNYHFYLDENSINGTDVGTVIANDFDTADKLSYKIMEGEPYNPFFIGTNSGQITVNGDYLLNYEFVQAYTLTVSVTDGIHFNDTQVLVSLNDKNEFTPQFASEAFEYTVAENIAAGSYIGQILATDDDPGNLLIYRITAGNEQKIFKINDDGNLSIDDADGLDYESQDAYTLTVQVSDGKFNDTTNVHINIKDVNDAPEIILSLFPRVPSIQGGSLHSLALNTSGTVLSFGYNQHGQLGNDTMIDKRYPVPVFGNHDFVKMDTRYYHAIALGNDSSVWTWGWNAKGQLGNGDTSDLFAPTQVTGLSSVVGVSAGAHHSMALLNDGTIKTWGTNSSGQLGDGTRLNRLRPVSVKGLGSVKAIHAAYYHSLAIIDDNRVMAWGKNTGGQLGDGTEIDKLTPVLVSELVNVVSISGGLAHSMALKKNGTVWTWGYNDKGQLGIDSTENRNQPTMIENLSHIIAIAAGGEHSMALQEDGTIWIWGLNDYGQLGNDTTTFSQVPVKLESNETFIAIAAGEKHSLALTTDGTVWAWGLNSRGQLGNNTIDDSLIPIKVNATNNLEPLNIGQQQPPTIIIKEDNQTEFITFKIKDAETPVQGLSVSADADNPILVPNDQIDLSCIDDNCKAMITPSHNDNGETMVYFRVNDGEKTSVAQIRLVVEPTNDPPTISQIPDQRTDENIATDSIGFIINDLESDVNDLILMARSSNPLVVPDDHIVFGGTGKNRFVSIMPGNDQSGIATITLTVRDQTAAASTSFTLTVNAAPDITDIGDIIIAEDQSTGFIVFDVSDAESDFTQLTVVGFSSDTSMVPDENIMVNCSTIGCTVMIVPNKDKSGKALITLRVSDGYAISEDTFQLTVEPGNDPPEIAIDLATGNPAIAVGAYHSLAVRGGNEVMAWGRNDMGQLGLGTSGEGSSQSFPNVLSGLINIVDLAAGENHSLALSDSGDVWAWGNNSHGQLGIGAADGETEIDKPEKVLLLTDIIAIDGGYAHSLALQSNGTVWAWGNNTHGQLGIGKSGIETSESIPNLIQTLDSCISIAAGYGHSVALKKDGTVWTWGFNSSGQLGDGTEIDRNQPAIVPGLSNIISIAAGDYHTVALKNDGTVWTWGDNPFGQLGDDTTLMKNTPTRVLYISNVISVAAGYVHTLALKNDGTVWGWGGNVYGQLGDNTTEMRTRPVKADLFPKAIAIEAGHYHSMALKSDGSVWSFGANSFGQLGDGTLKGESLPLQVHGENNVDKLNIGTPYFIDEDSQTGAILFSINDEETPAEHLVVSASSSNPRLVPETKITLEGTGRIRSITVKPEKNQFGRATITIKVSDGLSSSTDSFTLWINEINDGPQISDIGYQSIDEDTPSPDIPFTVNDMETPADYLLVYANSSNKELIPNSNIIISGIGINRTIKLIPAENMYGIATITLEVSDGVAVVSDTFTVRVKDVNDPPVISDIPDQMTDEDTPTSAIVFSVSDMETPAGNLIVTASTSDPEKVPVSNLLIEGSGQSRTVTITPVADQNGNVQITLNVSDGSLNAQKSFDLYIEPVDDSPKISKIANQETFEYVATIPIPFTITDAETPSEDLILMGTSSDTIIVTNENITFTGEGEQRSIVISPQEEQFGTTDITIAVSDGNNTIVETFSLTVNPQRDWDVIDSIVSYSDLEDIWGRSANDIYAVGNGGAIFHYNGISWSKVVTTYDDDFNAIWGDVGMVYVVGNNGIILQYNGYSWSKMFTGTSEHLYSVWGNGRSVFAVGTYGTILKYNGVSWTEMSSSTTTTLLDIWGNENKMYAAGNGGLVLVYNGYDWQPMTKVTAYSLRGVWGSSETDVFAVGDGGTIIHYDGQDWKEMERGNFSSLKGIWGLSGNKVYAAGLQGTIVNYDGTKWSETESGVAYPLMGIWGASITDIYVVGENGTILRRSTGQIKGKITTTITGGNSIVVGASVTIKETGQQTTTDDNGIYHFDNVPIGAYTVLVSSEYFSNMTIDNVRVPGGEVSIPDITLSDLKTGLYSQEELDNAVYKERIKYDPDADGVISVENIIYFLKWMTEIQ